MPCRPGAPAAWGSGLATKSSSLPSEGTPRWSRAGPHTPRGSLGGRPRPACPSPSPSKDTSPSGRAAGFGDPGCPLPLGHPTPTKSSQRQKRSCLELKCAVFLKGREMSHRKYYKKGLSLSAVQTLLRPHALYSGGAPPLTAAGPGLGGGAAGRGGGGRRALGELLLLEPPFGGRGQHPATQGHGVRGRAFRQGAALGGGVDFRTSAQETPAKTTGRA